MADVGFSQGLSLAGSAFSTAMTAYFWLRKSRGERPNLHAQVAPTHTSAELGQIHDGLRRLDCTLTVIVANYSSLPNAVVGGAVAWKGAAGGWCDLGPQLVWAPLPLNLPPLATGMLQTKWMMRVPVNDDAENEPDPPGGIIAGYFARCFGEPSLVRITLHGLKGKSFTVECGLDPRRVFARSPMLRVAA